VKLVRVFFALGCLVWLTGATWLPLFQQAAVGGGCPASANFLARTSGLNGTETTAYQGLICGLVTDGIITGNLSGVAGCGTGSFDAFYVFATNSQTTANLNICGTGFTGSISGTVTFTADQGYVSDGSTGFFNTGFNPSTAGGQMTLNSGSYGLCIQTSRTASTALVPLGGDDGTNFVLYQAKGSIGVTFDLNDAAFASLAESNSQGSWIVTRSSSSLINLSLNGGTLTPQAGTSTALTNANIFILAFNSNGTASDWDNLDQISYAFLGPNFSQTQVTAIYNRLHTFLAALGNGAC
jgi:hypothetical protein